MDDSVSEEKRLLQSISFQPEPKVADEEELLQDQTEDLESKTPAHAFRLFCFVWTPRRPCDERLMPYARKELKGCDRHAFFTDVDAPGNDGAGDWIRVQLPPTNQPRDASNWLDHSNMIGVARVWDRIFEMDLAAQYDWILHVELDHFVMVDRVRSSIQSYLDVIKQDGGPLWDENSLLLCWGNAFVFNRALVHEMAKHWGELGAPIQEDIPGKGCPAILAQRVYDDHGHCEQDMAYPKLAIALGIKKYGAEGCNKPSWTPWGGHALPLACWQGFDLNWTEEMKARMIRGIALVRGANNMSEAYDRCAFSGDDIVANMCKALYDASHVPLMHNFKTPEMHELAQQLLSTDL